MDIRGFFHKVQEVEQTITTPWVLMVSKETSTGARAGVMTEVKRSVAARLIVAGTARPATDEEEQEYRAEQQRALAAAEQAALAGRVQLAVLSEQELRALRSNLRQKG